MSIIERYPCVIGTAGHIDHGKTSLVAALTGTDTDRLPEEKRRGLSIDLGFAAIDLGDNDSPMCAGLIDVPGHERFIKNMLAGATGIDVALFCVAANDGIMPQTREHFEIIRLLGVSEAVFAITKSDCVTPRRVDEVTQAVAGLTLHTTLAGSAIIAVSSKTGTGIDGLRELLRQAALRSLRPDALSDAPFRLPIDRSFHVKGFGTVVTGTVASGSIKKGAELLCYPSGAVVKVRGIECLHAAVDSVKAGQRAAINITAASDTDTGRGVMLVSPELGPFVEAALRKSAYAECSFEFIREIDFKKGRKVFKAHHLTAESTVTIRLSNPPPAPPFSKGGSLQLPRPAPLGAGTPKERSSNEDTSCGRLVMATPLLALRGDRIILRDTGRNETIGVAVVNALWLDKKTMPKRLPPLEKGKQGGIEPILRRILDGCGGITLAEAALIFNMHKEALSEAVAKDPAFAVRGNYIMSSKTVLDAETRLLDAVTKYHASNPTEPGMREEAALKALSLKDAASLVRHRLSLAPKTLLESLTAAGRLTKNGALVAAPGFRPASNDADAKIEADIKAKFSTGFALCNPQDLARLPHNKADVDRVFAWLVRNGAIIKLCEGSYLSCEAITEARSRLFAHLKTNPGITAAQFRDIVGCGRKLAIEILEYFDKERVTLRQGDLRTLRQ